MHICFALIACTCVDLLQACLVIFIAFRGPSPKIASYELPHKLYEVAISQEV